jgi:spermidine/putrescine-binding protein
MNEITNVHVRYISRREFMRRIGITIGALAASSAAAACSAPAPGASAPKAAAAPVSGQLDFYSWEGYDLLETTKQWRADHNIDLKSAYIASSEDTPAKVLSPAGKGIDLITYFFGYWRSWSDLNLFSEFTADEVPNVKRMYPLFRDGEFWRSAKDKAKYVGVPLTWLTYVCNYRSDMTDPPEKWSDLLDAKYKGKIAIVEDPGALILTAATILGYKSETMTKKELAEIKKFLLGLKANAKTIAASYGDLSNLLISGEVVATYVGWAALDVWAAKDNVTVSSVLPSDGVTVVADAYAIPTTADNRPAALAWLDLMLTDAAQLAVANELLTATVVPEVVPLIKDEKVRKLYDYDNIEAFIAKHPFTLFPPNTTTTDQASFTDWMKMWEEVKAA